MVEDRQVIFDGHVQQGNSGVGERDEGETLCRGSAAKRSEAARPTGPDRQRTDLCKMRPDFLVHLEPRLEHLTKAHVPALALDEGAELAALLLEPLADQSLLCLATPSKEGIDRGGVEGRGELIRRRKGERGEREGRLGEAVHWDVRQGVTEQKRSDRGVESHRWITGRA